MRYCFLILIVFFSSCSSNTEPSADYLERLQNVLEVNIDLLEGSEPLTYPRKRLLDKQSTKSNNNISIRDFLSLRECKLHLVIAKRNSLIGKVAPASHEHTPECIEQLTKKNNQTMIQKLKNYFEFKKTDIVSNLWKAILGSVENASFWQARPQPKNYPLVC